MSSRRDQPPLQYQPTSDHHRHLKIRWIILFALVIAGFIVWKELPAISHRLSLLYWQHQCLNYEFPAGQVAADFSSVQNSHGTVAAPWQAFYREFSPPGLRSDATIFLHERISPGGNHRLVAVDLYRFTDPSTVRFGSEVIIPGTLTADPKEPAWGSTLKRFPTTLPYRVIAGVLDLSDASHFSFEIDHGSSYDVINGWLRDDDQLILELTPASVTQPVQLSPASSR